MKLIFYLTVSIIFITPLISPINAAEKSISIVCAEWPGYTNQDGTGIYWELVKVVYQPLGFKVHTQVVPWKRAEIMVESNKADILVGDYYYPEKDGKTRLYPEWHLSVEDPIVGIIKKNSHKIVGFNSLLNKSVVWMRGYDFDKIYLKNIPHEMQEIDSEEKGLQLVKHDRYDVFLDYRSNLERVAKETSFNLSSFEIVIMKFGNKLFLNFSNTEHSRKLIKIYDQRIPELLKSGELEKIYKAYKSDIGKFGPGRYGGEKK